MTKRKRPRTVVIERKLGREQAAGQAYPDGLVEIDPRQDARNYLGTAVHELMHFAPGVKRLTEIEVLALADHVATQLWKIGYRKVQLK